MQKNHLTIILKRGDPDFCSADSSNKSLQDMRISYEELKMRAMMLMAKPEDERRLLTLGRYSTVVKNTLSLRLFDNGCSER